MFKPEIKSKPDTDHISYKKHEKLLKERVKELGNIFHKNKSDTYKYCLNKVYLLTMEQKENGQHIYIC